MAKHLKRLLAFIIVSTLILSACSKEKTAQEYLQDGREYLEAGDVSKAIASLEEALKKEPGLAEAHRILGEALGRGGRWPEAVAQFVAYLNLADGDAAAHFLLGQAYVQTGDFEKAAASFAQGASIDPAFLASYGEEIAEVADDILMAGKDALETGDIATATDLLTIVAPLVPGQGEVFLLLGQAHQEANNIVPALEAFASAVNLNPELADDQAEKIDALAEQGLEMGQAALDSGDLSTAARILDAVATLLPKDPKVHFLLGNVYNQANQFAQAIERYQTVLSLEPESSSAHTNMGVVYYKTGDLETAIEEYRAALDIEPDDAETHYLLGAAFVQMEQLEQGKAEFEAALELDDQLAPSYIGMGNVHLLQGEIDLALEMANQAVALSPGSPEAHFLLGQVYLLLGDVTEARSALEMVLSLNPAQPWREQVERMLESLDSN